MLTPFPAILFPAIDPVAIALGPLAIRWYALAYIAGLILGWRYVLRLSRKPGSAMTPKDVDDFIVWATIGVILGGRLGYVLFYRPGFYLENLEHVLYVWQGGMSFHGGLLGVTAAIILFSRQRKLQLFAVSDMVAMAAPIGLFFGRIANFINAELFGRATDVPWGVIFPNGGPEPRHPSQLYEAGLEGIVLMAVLAFLYYRLGLRDRPGVLTGVFLIGYALSRIIVELFREPDAHLGFILNSVTMGQILSLPLLAFGIWMVVRAAKSPQPATGT